MAPTNIEELDLPRVDVMSPEYEADPTGILRAARESGGGMMKTHRGVEFLTNEWVSELLNDDRFHTVDARHFAEKGAPDSLVHFAEDGLLLSLTGPRHDRIRRVLLKAFTLRKVDENLGVMREVAHAKIDGFIDRGRCDLVEAFTEPYPMEVLCRVIGVPIEDVPRFMSAARDLHLMAEVPMAPGFERIDGAFEVFNGYVRDLVELRRESPQDDLITGVLEAQRSEGALTESEMLGNFVNLLFAGAGTTRFGLSSTLAAIIEHGLWEEIAKHPEMIPNVVEESLRLHTVTQFVVRIPDEDVVIGDFLFPARRRILLNLEAASRDPATFDDPDTFDVERPHLARSRLPFGHGTHHCLGAGLARATMRDAVACLTGSLADVKIASAPELSPARGMLRGPDRLEVSFKRR